MLDFYAEEYLDPLNHAFPPQVVSPQMGFHPEGDLLLVEGEPALPQVADADPLGLRYLVEEISKVEAKAEKESPRIELEAATAKIPHYPYSEKDDCLLSKFVGSKRRP